ncbi:MAG: pantoate--beta-alanine ligase [Salibacteraceae bacterium]
MKVIRDNASLSKTLGQKSVGFIPTMGALHSGHLSLVEESLNRGLYTVVCIFVNPTQFNNQGDFDNYPVNTDRDIELLNSVGCDVAFIPTRGEIYPDGDNGQKYIHDFGELENKYEGEFRPGHFKGVGQVVHRLFDIVSPTQAFFGEKDFQQLAIVRELVRKAGLNVEIVGMPTVRRESGLAMSSRNQRLNPEQIDKAVLLYKSLAFANDNHGKMSIEAIKFEVASWFKADQEWNLEYFEIIEPATFQKASEESEPPLRAIIAASLGVVRLIDNMAIKAS